MSNYFTTHFTSRNAMLCVWRCIINQKSGRKLFFDRFFDAWRI